MVSYETDKKSWNKHRSKNKLIQSTGVKDRHYSFAVADTFNLHNI